MRHAHESAGACTWDHFLAVSESGTVPSRLIPSTTSLSYQDIGDVVQEIDSGSRVHLYREGAQGRFGVLLATAIRSTTRTNWGSPTYRSPKFNFNMCEHNPICTALIQFLSATGCRPQIYAILLLK
jgi:hypothetical protein